MSHGLTFSSFYPPIRFLMGAGPTTLHPRVASAFSRPVISHLDPSFLKIFRETQELLRYVMHTKSLMTFAAQGPGSAAMEMCIANLIEPGDGVIILSNGVYGQRMLEMATIYGANVVYVDHEWGEALSPERLEEALIKHKNTKVVCFVHGESSTGVMSDIQKLAKICEKYGALSLVDMAATFGGQPILIDEWGLDAVYANPQKCLSAPPGLAPISFSARAMDKILNRKFPVASWCFDVRPIYENITNPKATRVFSHTSPSNCFYALHEALLMIHEEGIENVWERHHINGQALFEGLRALGLTHTTQNDIRIPNINVLWLPKNIMAQEFRKYLIQQYYLEIGDGMGKWFEKTIRIGSMGQSSTKANVLYCISAVAQTLQHFGHDANINEALAAVKGHLHHD